jgi:hypothetical protein
MATQTIQVEALSGETLTMEVFSLTSDTAQASASATEATNRHGLYVASFTDLTAGSHRCMMVDGSNNVVSVQYCTTTAATETVQSYDSLSGISGTVDANIVSSSAPIDANITQVSVTPVVINTGLSEGKVTQVRGDTWGVTITNLGDLTGYSDIWFTGKRSKNDPDANSWVQIKKSVGLVYIDGTAATTAGNASITATNAAGDGEDPNYKIVVSLAAVESAKLPERKGFFDVQVITGSAVVTRTIGDLIITGDVTQASS